MYNSGVLININAFVRKVREFDEDWRMVTLFNIKETVVGCLHNTFGCLESCYP